MLDAAIIGAGPAGLSAAAALIQCHPEPTRVQVFDHITEFKTCGAGLGLRINGYTALDAIDSHLSKTIASLTYKVHDHSIQSLDGKVVQTIATPKAAGQHSKLDKSSLGWSELRNALADYLPSGSIQLGKRLLSLEQHPDFVTLHFSDGSSVDAKVVIGADGSFSKVRQHTLDDGLPEFSGATVWRARMLASPGTPKKSYLLTGGKLLATYYPIGTQGQFVWTVCASEAQLKAAGISAQHGPSRHAQSKENQLPDHNQQNKDTHGNSVKLSAAERCRRVWGNNAKFIPELIDATDESTILEHNLYARQPDNLDRGHWGQGRVTLVGDAAHCMRPGSGQGVNQAFEDAVILAQAIKDGGLTEASLRAFESQRIPRLQEIMAAEMVLGLKAYADCPAEMPDRLKPFKHAKAKWHGTDDGAYDAWVLNRSFEALTAQQHNAL